MQPIQGKNYHILAIFILLTITNFFSIKEASPTPLGDYLVDEKYQQHMNQQEDKRINSTANLISEGKIKEAAQQMMELQSTMVVKIIREAFTKESTTFDEKVTNTLSFIDELPYNNLVTIAMAYNTTINLLVGHDLNNIGPYLMEIDQSVDKKLVSPFDQNAVTIFNSVKSTVAELILSFWNKLLLKQSDAQIEVFSKKYEKTLQVYAARLTKAVWDRNSSTKVNAEKSGNLIIYFSNFIPTSCKKIILKELYSLMEKSDTMPLSTVMRLAYRDHHEYNGTLNIISKLPKNLRSIIKGKPVTIMNAQQDLVLTFDPDDGTGCSGRDIYGIKQTPKQMDGSEPTPKWIFNSTTRGYSFYLCSNVGNMKCCLGELGGPVRTDSTGDIWRLLESPGHTDQYIITYYSTHYLNVEAFDVTRYNGKYTVFASNRPNGNRTNINPHWIIESD